MWMTFWVAAEEGRFSEVLPEYGREIYLLDTQAFFTEALG
jgi:hypothetical protein